MKQTLMNQPTTPSLDVGTYFKKPSYDHLMSSGKNGKPGFVGEEETGGDKECFEWLPAPALHILCIGQVGGQLQHQVDPTVKVTQGAQLVPPDTQIKQCSMSSKDNQEYCTVL